MDKGPLLTADQVASEILNGTLSPAWVRLRMRDPESGRIQLGKRTVRWYANLARAWVQGSGAPTPNPKTLAQK